MALTQKQERNGIPEQGPAGGNVAQPGPSADFAGVKGAAEVYGNDWQESGKAVFDGGGLDFGGVVDWDRNVAVTEGVGEA